MKVKGLVLFSLLFFCVMPVSSQRAEAATVRQQFKASVAELQKNPDNQELRKKIIKLSLKLKPRPAVPEEAERRHARGRAYVKRAKNKAGFKKAADEFQKAVDAAPWLAEGYFNLGVTQEKAELYAEAIESFKLYLLAAPNAKVAKRKQVKNKIFGLEVDVEESGAAAKPKGFEGRWDIKRRGELRPYMTVTRGADGKIVIQSDMPNRPIENFSVNASGKHRALDFEEIISRHDPPRFIDFKANGRVIITYEDRNGWRMLCALELDGAILFCEGFPIQNGQFDASGDNDIKENLYRRKD